MILVFSFALASSLDVTAVDRGFLQIVGLLALITVCSFTLHGLLCRLFRIDADWRHRHHDGGTIRGRLSFRR